MFEVVWIIIGIFILLPVAIMIFASVFSLLMMAIVFIYARIFDRDLGNRGTESGWDAIEKFEKAKREVGGV